MFHGPQRLTMTIGWGSRRAVRRQLLRSGLQFTEERGPFDALFVVGIPAGVAFTVPDEWVKEAA